MDWQGKRVLVLGLGKSGQAAAGWLARRGASLRAADEADRPAGLAEFQLDAPEVVVHLGAWRAEDLAWAELVVVSPGVSLAVPVLRDARARGLPFWSDVEVFAHAVPASVQVLAVTGSNGKSTVASMVAVMCEAAGLNTVLAGNIGVPVLAALDSHPEAEVFVLELSSFQLETIISLRTAAAAILNVSEDHLDRYPDMSAYVAAKARIFSGAGLQVVNRDDVVIQGLPRPDAPVVSFGLGAPVNARDYGLCEGFLCRGTQRLLAAQALRVAGRHNAANALAALALCHALGLPDESLVKALSTFSGLPHRVQWVARVGEVDFYDDSKGTNVGATEAAVTGLERPVVLIAGGDGKGQDFSPLAGCLPGHARAVVQMGRDGGLIATALVNTGLAVVRAEDMQDAVTCAFRLAQPGDAILLSPACASFDMFDNYVHRAQVFVAAVNALASGVAG